METPSIENIKKESAGEEVVETIDFDPMHPESVELIAQAIGEAMKRKIIDDIREAAEQCKEKEERSGWFRELVLDKIARFYPVAIGSLGRPEKEAEKLPFAKDVLREIITTYKKQQV